MADGIGFTIIDVCLSQVIPAVDTAVAVWGYLPTAAQEQLNAVSFVKSSTVGLQCSEQMASGVLDGPAVRVATTGAENAAAAAEVCSFRSLPDRG